MKTSIKILLLALAVSGTFFSCSSDEDFADYVAAANRMLEEKGAAPLNLGPILNRKLKANKQPEERK